MRCALLLTALLIPAASLAGEKPSGRPRGPEWPQHRGNAGGTGVSPDASVKPPLKLVWSYRCDSDTTGDAGAGLTVGGGKVFCNMEMTKSILALDAETGKFCWEFSDRFVHYTQTSSCADGKLFVWLRYSRHSRLVALDVETGKPVWEKKFKTNQGISFRRFGPAIADGKVLMADGGDPVIVALDVKTGSEVWRRPLDKTDGDVVMAPTIAGGKVFTGTRVKFTRGMKEAVHGAVIALNLKDGKEVWRNRKIYPCLPPVSDGTVVIAKTNREVAMKANPNQKMYVLDAKTGQEIWSVPIKNLYGTTTITKDKIIQKHYGGGIAAFERKTGNKLWTRFIRTGSGCCSPSISGDCAYVGTGSFNDSEGIWAWRFATPPHKYKGATGASWTFHAIDLKTGKTVWEFLTGCNACGDPAIAYGRLYLNSRDGRIYCLAPVKKGEPASVEAVEELPNAPEATVRKLLAEKLPAPRPGRDWPMLGGTPERAGLPVSLNPPLTPAWKLDTGGRITGSAAIRDGKVYIGSYSGKIICANLRSGAKTWEFDTGAEVKCSPAVAGGLVYCGSDSGGFYALDAATGAKKWSFKCGGPVQASPAVLGGAVVFGANDHNIYMLDRKTGGKLWSFRTSNQLVQAPPVVKGGQVFAASWIDWAYALDAATGKQQWKTCVPISIEALHFYRGRLWLRTPRQFAEFDPASGKRLRLGNLAYGYNGLAFMKNLLFYAGTGAAGAADMDQEGKLNRHEKTQPALKGVRVLGARGLAGWPRLASMGTPLVVGEEICFASKKGKVILVKPDPASISGRYVKQKQLWSFAMGGTCHATPVAADGMLVVGCDDGKLYAFRGK